MPHFTRAQRRRWSLPLVVVLLLHWTVGICAAAADVLCIEPTGRVALEPAGKSCKGASLEAKIGKPCLDFKVGEQGDSHDGLTSYQVGVDLPPVALIPALGYVMPEPVETALRLPLITGPPIPSRSVVLRATAVLLI